MTDKARVTEIAPEFHKILETATDHSPNYPGLRGEPVLALIVLSLT
jgi:hypothetical protein